MFDLSRVPGVRVLVVGDVMLDRYWFGGVERISPEAPVPVIAVQTTEERAGGAANVAFNVARLGAHCRLLSVVGEDEAGANLRALLEKSGIDCRLHTDKDFCTTAKLRIISRNQQLLRADFERSPGHEVLARCLDDFRQLVGDSDVVILSDYGKGGLKHIVEMIGLARTHGVPVMIDPKGRDFTRYRGATMITPNRREFEDVAGECESEQELEDKARALVRELAIEQLLITRSEKGMSLYGADGDVLHSPARARDVYDVSGAGDTVIATIAVARAAGASLADALHLANTAAGVVVGKLGTAAVTRAELEHALAEQE